MLGCPYHSAEQSRSGFARPIFLVSNTTADLASTKRCTQYLLVNVLEHLQTLNANSLDTCSPAKKTPLSNAGTLPGKASDVPLAALNCLARSAD
jgi:hypothetical protein